MKLVLFIAEKTPNLALNEVKQRQIVKRIKWHRKKGNYLPVRTAPVCVQRADRPHCRFAILR